MNRPHSLIKALINPVQDGSGLLEASTSRASTLSPDLMIHLPTADLTPDTDLESSEVDAKPDLNMLINDHVRQDVGGERGGAEVAPPVATINNNNSNNNNNNLQPHPVRLPSADSATSGFASSPDTPTYLKGQTVTIATSAKKGTWRHNSASIESGIEQEAEHDLAWYQSTTPSPYHPPPTSDQISVSIKSDGEDYDHLIVEEEDDKRVRGDAGVSAVSSISSIASDTHKQSLSPVLSPRTVPPQQQVPPSGGTSHRTPIDLSSLSPILQTSFSSKIHRGHESSSFMSALSPHYSSFHARHRSDMFSYPLSASYDNPPLSADQTRRIRGSTPNSRRFFGSQNQLQNDKDFAVEKTLQSAQKPQLVRSFDNHFNPTPPHSPPTKGVYTSTDGLLNRRPLGYDTSGRGTPDNPRAGYKVY